MFSLEHYMEATKPTVDPIDELVAHLQTKRIRRDDATDLSLLCQISEKLDIVDLNNLSLESIATLNTELAKVHDSFSQPVITMENVSEFKTNINMGFIDGVKNFFTGLVRDWKHMGTGDPKTIDGLRVMLERLNDMDDYAPTTDKVTIDISPLDMIAKTNGQFASSQEINGFIMGLPDVARGVQKKLMDDILKNDKAEGYSVFANTASMLGCVMVYEITEKGILYQHYAPFKDAYGAVVTAPEEHRVIYKFATLRTTKELSGTLETPVMSVKDMHALIDAYIKAADRLMVSYKTVGADVQSNTKTMDDIAETDIAKARRVFENIRAADKFYMAMDDRWWGMLSDMVTIISTHYKTYKRGAAKKEE